MRIILSLFIVCFSFFSFSQEKVKIVFIPLYEGERIELNSKLKSDNETSLEINTLRFYVSNIELSNENEVWKDPLQAHLIDLEDSSSLRIETENIKAESIRFLIGIDSLTNVSGILDGDLDPIKGMYWTWNSGYINFKLEGKSSQFKQNNGVFEYHIGGYLPPYKTVQEINLPIHESGKTIEIEVELSTFLNDKSVVDNQEIMIPGKEASNLAQIFQTIFKIREDEK